MKRLGDGDVEPARDDLFFGLPVISRFHELNIQARVREEARALCDDLWARPNSKRRRSQQSQAQRVSIPLG